MACSFGCRCRERDKPANRRAWTVWQRHCSHSAFNGYRRKVSQYSTVRCLVCGALGRTRARWVDQIPDWLGPNETLDAFYIAFPDRKTD